MNSDRLRFFCGWALVLAGGLSLGWWKRAAFETAVVAEGTRPARQQFFAALGPTASLAADGFWLRLNLAWEQRDEAAVRALIGLTLAAEPEGNYFRRNAARLLAFDLPAWRVAERPHAPAVVVAAWRERGAEEAIALLGERAEPELIIEAANITLYGRRDRAAAAQLYRRAAELPDAPWHAGRIYAQLLREQGRDREALDWLRSWLPRLPAEDPAAQRELVEQRIADLELELRSRGEPL